MGATEGGKIIDLVCAVNSMGWNLGEKRTQTEVNLKVPANKQTVRRGIDRVRANYVGGEVLTRGRRRWIIRGAPT